MLSEEWLPTLLIQREERQKVEIVEPAPEPRFASLRVIGRFLQFWLVSLWLYLTRRYNEDAAAEQLRSVFEDLGGLWIKVGQLLSLRTDIFSEAICRELSRLQYRAQGFPIRFVYEALQADLGEDLGLIFESFQEAPVAAASISQVHRAVLRNPHVEVAVKIRRPDADASFKRDLRNIERMFRIFETLGFAPHMCWSDAYWELDQMVREELDLRPRGGVPPASVGPAGPRRPGRPGMPARIPDPLSRGGGLAAGGAPGPVPALSVPDREALHHRSPRLPAAGASPARLT